LIGCGHVNGAAETGAATAINNARARWSITDL